MFGLLLRTFTVVVVGCILTACGTHPRPVPEVQEIYEIRGVAVTANSGVSKALIRGIKLRLDDAIANTVRPAPMPRAVMNIHVVTQSSLQGYDGTRTDTEISVALTDVPSGQALLVRSFLVSSFSISPRDANESAAEAIAARLRAEYALSQPVIHNVPADSRRMSTRVAGDETRLVKEEKPLVIPLRTAPVVGADRDPMLNSKTKIAPDQQDNIATRKAVGADAKPKKANAVAESAVEDGAKVKVVIKPKATTPATDEPCVETMSKKC